MKRIIALILVLFFAVLLPATSSLAGSRYHSSRYYGGYGGYGGHYYPYHYGHSHHSDDLAFLGVGLLTGVVLGSILYQPPPERQVVYSAPPVVYSAPPVVYPPPPPVIVQRSPVVVVPRSEYYADNEVLRQVKATVRMLNLRSGPDLDDEVIGQATFGEVLGVIGAAPEWLYVKTQNGQYGWVMTQYTQALAGPVG